MIYEKIPLHFDIEKLRDHLKRVVLPLPPQLPVPWLGGWSVLSSNGSYIDGWQRGAEAFRPDFMVGATLAEKMAAIGVKRSAAYVEPTEICTGYMAEVISVIRDAGFCPMRARISLLKANSTDFMHRDAADGEYAVRLHVPLVTNEKCLFICDEGTAHLPAEGDAFLLRVNRMHNITNQSDTDRYHLMMTVMDKKHVSQFHRFPNT